MIPSLPKKSIRNLAIFAGALAAIVGLMVVPSYFAIGKAEETRKQVKAEVDEQRQLAPVFGRLVKKRKELVTAMAHIPQRAPLARDEAGMVTDQLTRLAVDTQMQMVGISADLNALVNDVKLMRVDLVLQGALRQYDVFLKALVRLPYLEFIEKLMISAVPGGQEYKLRIWIALN